MADPVASSGRGSQTEIVGTSFSGSVPLAPGAPPGHSSTTGWAAAGSSERASEVARAPASMLTKPARAEDFLKRRNQLVAVMVLPRLVVGGWLLVVNCSLAVVNGSIKQRERWWASLMMKPWCWVAWVVVVVNLAGARAGLADDDALVITPPGFNRPGMARTASGALSGRLKITVRDRGTNRLTPCRINVVGPDGNFYQPTANRLSAFSLTGEWPQTGKGNRPGKGPFRYIGRFFYTTGEAEVVVPSGAARVEVWKGFEYQPIVRSVTVAAGESLPVSIELERTTPMAALGYLFGRSAFALPAKIRSRRPNDPRIARSRGYPVRLDPGFQRTSRPLRGVDGDDVDTAVSGPG